MDGIANTDSNEASAASRLVILVQGNDNSISLVKSELPSFDHAQLVSPLAHHGTWQGRFAIDNGAFNGFDPEKYSRLLKREWPNRSRCIFATAPDVVGSARRTGEVFQHWYPKLERWPIAFVAQDGVEDLPIPWHLLSAIFIGGSTSWKLSASAASVIAAAKAMGKWVHIGRVNSPQRVDKFLSLGADSIDGASLARHGAGYARDRKRIEQIIRQPKLIEG